MASAVQDVIAIIALEPINAAVTLQGVIPGAARDPIRRFTGTEGQILDAAYAAGSHPADEDPIQFAVRPTAILE